MSEIRHRLVRAEATEEMDIAGRSAPTMLTPTGTATAVKLVFAAMCSSSPPPTAEDIASLTRLFWGEDEEPRQGFEHDIWELTSKRRREQMRAFVAHLTGQETT